mmetsp:Transcript_3404/g.8034  ORF Transcript_3404/g.8034 Transcript_3404/m.8034 type:complete len:209 (-) Transcript_3404:3413-4039(-)
MLRELQLSEHRFLTHQIWPVQAPSLLYAGARVQRLHPAFAMLLHQSPQLKQPQVLGHLGVHLALTGSAAKDAGLGVGTLAKQEPRPLRSFSTLLAPHALQERGEAFEAQAAVKDRVQVRADRLRAVIDALAVIFRPHHLSLREACSVKAQTLGQAPGAGSLHHRQQPRHQRVHLLLLVPGNVQAQIRVHLQLMRMSSTISQRGFHSLS